MQKINIPIYRAKKIDNDEWVEGYITTEFHEKHIKYFMHDAPTEINQWCGYTRIDPNTLAIHFPNMIDKNGKKIFASLSEDGVGGDVLDWKDIEGMKKIAKYSRKDGAFILIWENSGGFMNPEYCKNFEVIGIHKGE